MEDFPSDGNLSNKSMQPIAIVSQLLQLVASMHHIDELFMWLATILLERFSMISVQIWAAQTYYTGSTHRKLRVSISRRSSQALQMFESAEVRVFVERMLHEQRGVLSIPVSSTFSHYQSAIFAQEDCFYWTAYFLSKDVLLPPPQKQSGEEIPTPLQILFSFFTQKPLQTSQARAISFLIEQSLRIAISHGLFSITPEKSEGEGIQATFAYLIPERVQTTKIEQSENPFSSAVVIPEKRMRQMYSIIDGKKNIEELTFLTRMSRKEVLETLQSLLSKGYIQVCEVGGNPIDIASFPELS